MKAKSQQKILLPVNLGFFGDEDNQPAETAEDGENNAGLNAGINKRIEVAVRAALNTERAKRRIERKKTTVTDCGQETNGTERVRDTNAFEYGQDYKIVDYEQAADTVKRVQDSETDTLGAEIGKWRERCIKAEVKAVMMERNVDMAKLGRAFKNIELDACVNKKDGELNTAELERQIDELLEELPDLKKKERSEKPRNGFRVGANGGVNGMKEDYIKKIFQSKNKER